MSTKEPERNLLFCELDRELWEPPVVIGSEQFVNTVLEAQNQIANEELGDEIHEGAAFTKQCMNEANVQLTQLKAENLVRAVTTCLQNRFLGNCQIADFCTGRQDMDRRVAKLSQIEESISEGGLRG